MTKQILVAFLFCLSGTIANAQNIIQQTKPVACADLKQIFTMLSEPEVDEKPVWVGRDVSNQSDYGVFLNLKTGAFTIVQFGREVGCILGIGHKSSLLINQKIINF